MRISAQNQIETKVTQIQKGAVNSLITLETAQGTKLYASVMESEMSELGLRPGAKVTALFCASDVLIAGEKAVSVSSRNKLTGTVARVSKGAVNGHIDIVLDQGDPLFCVTSNDAIGGMDLKKGSKITALIKASDIVIAL